MTAAAEQGRLPTGSALSGLAKLTAARRPHPETLERLISIVRDLEWELAAAAGSERLAALYRTGTDIAVALTKGCTQPLLARSGYLERAIADQYEVDLDLLRGNGGPRTLTWLPRTGRGAACLGLWTGPAVGDRELEIVGVDDNTGALARLVGSRSRASQFPPAAMTRAGAASRLTLVLPVTSRGSDWGLLAIEGTVDTRMTSGRDKYNHWATLLAVALDHERLLASLHDQRQALADAANRERALADTLRASEERYALASMAAQDGTWDWDVSAGTVYYSPRWKQTLGYTEDEIGCTPSEWLDRVHSDDRLDLSAAIAAQLGGSRAPLEIEHRVRTTSGDYRWMMCRAVAVLDDAGCPARLVGAFVDMTDRKEEELALRRNTLRDPETGLAGRVLFLDRLGEALERSHTHDRAVLLARVVDPSPPTRADVRREVVRRLELILREGDSAARLRQDEFGVLLDQTRLQELLTQLTNLGVSVGVLPSIQQYTTPDDALRAADRALLRAQTRAR